MELVPSWHVFWSAHTCHIWGEALLPSRLLPQPPAQPSCSHTSITADLQCHGHICKRRGVPVQRLSIKYYIFPIHLKGQASATFTSLAASLHKHPMCHNSCLRCAAESDISCCLLNFQMMVRQLSVGQAQEVRSVCVGSLLGSAGCADAANESHLQHAFLKHLGCRCTGRKSSMQHLRQYLSRGMHAAMPAVLAQHLYNGDC